MKKSITKISAVVFAAFMVCAVIGCKPEPEETPENKPVNETTGYLEGAGETVSTGIKIGETTFEKTSEVAIVPAGKKAVIDMKDDSSWNSYVVDSADAYFKGVFVKDCKITLSPFVMSQYEVTQELYKAVMGTNPSGFTENAAEGEIQKLRPVDQVNHYEAVAFCNELTKKTMTDADVVYFSDEEKTNVYTLADADDEKTPYMDNTKKGYRLPTDAEWEYAARGGNPQSAEWKNAFGKVNTKDDVMIYDEENSLYEDENLATVGWYWGNSEEKTHEVGLKDKNSLNLYDMSGNIWEWCWDWYSDYEPEGRVGRGGSYYLGAYFCASSYRDRDSPSSKYNYNGFRVCRSVK